MTDLDDELDTLWEVALDVHDEAVRNGSTKWYLEQSKLAKADIKKAILSWHESKLREELERIVQVGATDDCWSCHAKIKHAQASLAALQDQPKGQDNEA